jgi:hypothetical protein
MYAGINLFRRTDDNPCCQDVHGVEIGFIMMIKVDMYFFVVSPSQSSPDRKPRIYSPSVHPLKCFSAAVIFGGFNPEVQRKESDVNGEMT